MSTGSTTVFRLDPNARTAGTSGIDWIALPPAFLVSQFGPPGRGTDDHKVSGQYKFIDARGKVFTIYDWKCTSLYLGPDSGAPTPKEFWADEEPYEFSIGGVGEDNVDGLNLHATAFREWLLKLYLGYHSVEAN